MTTRREFLLGGVGMLAAATAQASPAPPASPDRIGFEFADSAFPMIFAGDSIKASEEIRSVALFAPLFGGERDSVNPGQPIVSGSELRFDRPGEYYLRINGTDANLKALVLSRQEPISASVLRLFDFCVANHLYTGIDDTQWYGKRREYIRQFFIGTDPMMLSCGPTHAVFRTLITERFGLPSRVLTVNGTYLAQGTLRYVTHNVPEVYLPDKGRWATFDVNSGYAFPSADGFEICQAVRATWGDELKKEEDWRTLPLDIHVPMETRIMSPDASRTIRPEQPESARFRPAFLGRPYGDEDRTRAMRVFYTGPGYWGGRIGYVQPTGTEFLPGDFQLGSLHSSELLRLAVVQWIRFYQLEPTIVPPAELKNMLDDGHRTLIARKDWMVRLPASN